MSDTTILLAEVGAKISGGTNSKSFNLLYSASQTVDVEEFHIKCDSKGPTVTLLYGMYNTLFGGYTSENWTSTERQTKKDDDAFLFYKDGSAEAKCKFLPVKKNKTHKAITCDANFGPTFGGGSKKKYDLQVFKKDKNPKSKPPGDCMHLNGMLKVGRAYEEEMTETAAGKPKDKTNDINSGKLIVTCVEVYQVVDDELKDNWRRKPEDKECTDMKKKLIEMEQPGQNVEQYNILLVGVIKSGKSSFYNTLATVFSGKVTRAAAARASETSVTNKVENYVLKAENDKKLKIRITDIRGFEDKRGLDRELKHLLNGELPADYQFTDNPGSIENLRTDATLNDEIHLVCFVSGNTNFDAFTSTLHSHIKTIKETINEKGLPIAVVVTKVDELCPLVSGNVDHVYKCSKARDAANRVAEFYGEALADVFPVVNYVNQEENDKGIDRLALQALHGMYTLIQNHLRENKGLVKMPSEWEKRVTKLPNLNDSKAKEEVLKELQHELTKLQDRKLCVLLVGPVNSGKSSFIDSLSSALTDDIAFTVSGSYSSGSNLKNVSSTKTFKMFEVKHKLLDSSKVYFGDSPGFQDKGGITREDINFILDGHVPNNYQILNGIETKSKDFVMRPHKCDRIHCVCFVFDCESIKEGLLETLKDTARNVMTDVEGKGIKSVFILTKCDKVSESVRVDKSKVFEDNSVRDCKEKLMKMFSLRSQTLIYPVVNYVDENNTDLPVDALIIAAFKQILKFGKECLEMLENGEEEDGQNSEA